MRFSASCWNASGDGAESAYAETRFYLYRMETELASALWEEFGDRELAMEHLRLCDTEQANMSWESLRQLMEEIDPETAQEIAEAHQSERRSKRLRKIAGAVIPLALGIILFFIGTWVDPPLRGILEILGAASAVGALVCALSQAFNKVL